MNKIKNFITKKQFKFMNNIIKRSFTNKVPDETQILKFKSERKKEHLNFEKLLENNKEWSNKMREMDPNFFKDRTATQTPNYLFIGCSDSRVPAEQITGLQSGDIFVHRNIANLIVNSDMNSLSVIQYAVQVLKVKHIIVCGHYGCGGCAAATKNQDLGLIENWLRNIRDGNFYINHSDKISF
jgi:carbonic anhydrase